MRPFQTVRRSLAPLLCGPAAAAAIALSATGNARLEASAQPEPTARGMEFVGVFVDKESAKSLRAKYPSKFAGADDDQLFVVLKYNPTEKEKDVFAPILGRDARLQIKCYVENEQTQAVVVAVTTETGDPIEFEAGGELPHVTIASLEGPFGLNSGYSSVLLERLKASGKLQELLESADDAAEWTGELAQFESKHLPLFNPFPAGKATVRAAEKDSVINGTVCISSSYDPETGKCMSAPAKAECGFCKFMKAGPCGKDFTAWEACLDRCKANGLDFIEHCGKETLALRDCVDANPDYYSVLNESNEKEDEMEDEKEVAAEAK